MIAAMDSMNAGSWKFAEALRSFDAGRVRVDSLSRALDADLAAGASVSSLAELLERHHIARPLPADVYEALAGRLHALDEDVAAQEVTVDLDAPAKRAPVDALWGLDHTGPPLANRYQILELIARGGTGEVYKAIDLQQAALGDTNYYVAVKLLPAHTVGDETRQALEQHLARLQALVHASIARLLGWGIHGDAFYIAMEYIDGASLEARLRRGPLTFEQATLVLGKVADGLEAAHRQSIVHGDLTPANILLTESGEVKLIDFAWEGTPRRSLVTPRYASPQRMQRMAPTPADDVFALACVASELLAGKPLGNGASRRGPAPPPRHAQLSDAQNMALKHALEPERSARTPSARAFMQELSQPPVQPRRGWLKWLLAVMALAVVVGLLARRPAVVPPPAPPPVAVRPAPQPPPNAAGSVVRDCPTCAALRVLPAGTLVRGASLDDKAASSFERPQQTVTIAYSFAVAINAVTVGEFQEFASATGRDLQGCEIYDGKWRVDAAASWQSPGFAQTLLHPVTCVSWNDSTAYAAWLSARSGHHYRLPSAAEWEYAARAGGAAVPWASQTDACRAANVADQSAARRYPGFTVFGCDDSYVNTAPVGSYAANAFGLHDMLGNVFAWTQDCWSPSYAGAPQDGSALRTAGCAEHELRGGSWFSSPAFVRASYRNHFAADYRGSSVGIRLVRDLSP